MTTGIISSQVASYKKRIEPEAASFFTAAGITSLTQKAAVNMLAVHFKSSGLWTKCVAIYPFIGGTATAHKFNLKNAADTDAAFRLTYNGTVIHDAAGITIAASAGYIDTHINASTDLTLNDVHFALCAHNNNNLVNSAPNQEMGAQVGSTTSAITRLAMRAGSNYRWDAYNNTIGQGAVVSPNSSSQGFLAIGTRTAANASAYYRGIMSSNNFSMVSSITTSGGAPPNATVFIHGVNSTTVCGAQRIYTFAGTGRGFSIADAQTMYRLVRSVQITLQRSEIY